MSTPITAPSLILSTACFEALTLLVNLHDGIPAVYWQKAPGPGPAAAMLAGSLPGCLSVQAQADLLAAGYVGEATIEGPILVKAFATTDDAAQELLAAAVAALGAGIDTTVGSIAYRVALTWIGEVPLPETGGIYTAAARYRVTLRRA